MCLKQHRVPLRWYPPEYFNSHYYNFKGDVWAFGIVLWEMQTFGGSEAQIWASSYNVSQFVAYLSKVMSVVDKGNFTAKLPCLVEQKVTFLFQAHCHIQTWRHQRLWSTTLVSVKKTAILKDADQKCRWKHKTVWHSSYDTYANESSTLVGADHSHVPWSHHIHEQTFDPAAFTSCVNAGWNLTPWDLRSQTSSLCWRAS